MKLSEELSDAAARSIAILLMTGFLALIAFWLGKGPIAFVLFSIILLYLGRRLGWGLSKNVLYSSPVALALVLCLLWGVAVASAIHALIAWHHPNLVLKIIFGFMLGGYVAIPNYGLVAESTIPPEAMPKHNLISILPLCVYILVSIAFAWTL